MNLYEIEKKNTFILNTRIFSDISGENFGTITYWMIPDTFVCSILLFSYFKHGISCGWHLQIADLRRVQICEQMNNCRIFLYFYGFQYYAKKYSKQRKQLHICSQSGSTAWRSGRTAHCSLWPNSTLTESTYLLEVGKYVEFYSSGKINKSLLLKSYLPDKYFAPVPFFQTNFMIPYSQIYIEQSHHHVIHNFQTMSLYMAAIL